MDLFGPWSQRLGRTAFLTGIMVSLQKHLKSDRVPPCDPLLFDVFSDALGRFHSGRSAIEHQAGLLLYHPTQPSGWPVFHLMAGDITTEVAQYRKHTDQIWTAKGSAKGAWSVMLLRAAYILRLQGHSDEAAQLDLIVQEKNPVMWELRNQRYAEFASDKKLEGLRRSHRTMGNRTVAVGAQQTKCVDKPLSIRRVYQ